MTVKKSKPKQKVILVDPRDRKIGTEEKLIAHRFAMLHRAFSVVIFRKSGNRLQTLIQRRGKKKYHAGGLWSNICCSHPRPLENNLRKAAEKRLYEEMRIKTKLIKKGVFHYVAKFANGMNENEIDHVFAGYYDGEIKNYNRKEVHAARWVDVQALKKDIAAYPHKYTPWFRQALDIAIKSEKKSKQ